MPDNSTGITIEQILDLLAEKIAARISHTPIHASRLMDLAETAKYLGRSTSAIQHMVNRGALPITRLDTKVQVDRILLDKLIEKNTI